MKDQLRTLEVETIVGENKGFESWFTTWQANLGWFLLRFEDVTATWHRLFTRIFSPPCLPTVDPELSYLHPQTELLEPQDVCCLSLRQSTTSPAQSPSP